LSNIDPLLNSRIGVATTYGKPYFRFSTYLKALKLSFDSILPEDIQNYSGHLILTTHKESPKKCETPILHEDIFEHPPTVIRGIMMQKLNLDYEENDLILGIDPGERTGLSVSYYGKEIESSFHSSVDKLVAHIIQVLGGLRAKRKIIKIGNGNMGIAKQIVNMLNLKFCSSLNWSLLTKERQV